MRRTGVGVLVAGLLAAACWSSTPFMPPGTRSCLGAPVDVCDEQLARAEGVARQHGGLVAFALQCANVCTEGSGEAALAIRFGDGTLQQRVVGWTGPGTRIEVPPPNQPLAGLVPICIGIPSTVCDQRFREAVQAIAAADGRAPPIMAVVVRCTAVCDDRRGEGETLVTFADSREEATGWSFGSGL